MVRADQPLSLLGGAQRRPRLQTWSVPITAYGQFEGLNLPVRVMAVWTLRRR
jgi:hypothetical protein